MLGTSIAVPVLAQESLTWGSGDGSENNPYEVSSAGHLAEIATKGLDKCYKLTGNITVENWSTPIGNQMSSFTGTFDGGGNVITLKGSAGLFGQVGKSGETAGTVKNLGMDATIALTGDKTGTIAINNYGTIQCCFVKGSIQSGKTYPGGIAGTNDGTIEDCYSTVSITTSAGTNAGGIVGFNAGTIQRCYATGAINCSSSSFGTGAGGIVGCNTTNGTIKNCIALNKSITGYTTGRIACENLSSSGNALATNYASPLISGTWENTGANALDGEGLTDGNFINNATAVGGAFYGWNNGNTAWDFSTPANLPMLKDFNDAQPVKDITRKSAITAPPITEIKNATDLATLREAVRNKVNYKGIEVTLTASFAVDNWTEFIGSTSAPFLGTFNGGGNVITLTGSTALFGQIGRDGGTTGIVKNLGVDARITNATNYTGAIVQFNYGTIQNCFVKGSISSSNNYPSGIVGLNSSLIEDCYSTVSITANKNSYAGGIVGYNIGTIQRCYATGAIKNTNTGTSATAGGIAGYNDPSGEIKNCIALNESIAGKTQGRIVAKNDNTNALTNNYAGPLIPGKWDNIGANALDGEDLTEGNFITNATAVGGAFYGWNNGNTAWDFSTPANLPTLTGFQADVTQPVKGITRESILTDPLIKEIKNADDLATFRDAVNSGETYEGKTVTLANDITVTGWETGIGIRIGNNNDNNKSFSGTFDGQGHVINLTGSASLFGLIGKVNETYGTVKNLGVNAAITTNSDYAGGIVGYSYGTIQNCYTKGTITNATNYTGGIAGLNAGGGTIRNCYSTASCTAKSSAGGIVGYNSGKILQCYTTGAITGDGVGGIAGAFSGSAIELKNCIALNTSLTSTNTDNKKGRIVNSGLGTLSNNHASPLLPGALEVMKADKKDGADLTKENFISETTATGVFAEWPIGDDGWDLTTASLPTLKVFKDENNPQPAKGITRKERLMKLTIDSPEELAAFRTAVNGGETYENMTVKLTKDIEVTGWATGIASSKSFQGTFDGQGHVITLAGYTSLFAKLAAAGTVQNLGVKVNMNVAYGSTGGIVATNNGTIKQCYTTGEISGHYAGGIVGTNYGSVQDCYSTASITVQMGAGGIVQVNRGTIKQCYATGAISGGGEGIGGIAGDCYTSSNTIQNCIALNESIITTTGNGDLGRITGTNNNNGTLAGNYASLLIPGKWDKKDVTGLDGADLTSINFVNLTDATGAFAGWPTGDTGWDLTTVNLPTLKGFASTQPVASTTRVSKALLLSIASADDLDIFRTAVTGGETYEGKTVVLTGDITVEKWEKGIGNAMYPFLGTFDGAGHVINLTGSTSLFAVLGTDGNGKGTVQNLGVKMKIETKEFESTGGIVQYNYGTIKQCFTEGTITNDNDYTYAGGIAGQNHSSIQDCYSTVSITVTLGAGGIAQSNSGTIERCYATGAITSGNDGSGGIVGINSGSITKCIALNDSIKASSDLGRITSYNGENGALADNFASPVMPGKWSSKQANKMNGADLANNTFIGKGAGEGAFAEWLATAWEFGDNANLPKLKTTGLDENILIGGQGDGNGHMPARTDFLHKPTFIANAAELATFRDAVNGGKDYLDQIVKLTADITVTDWATGIGTDATIAFKGTFDGQGHVITLKGSTSLFGYIGDSFPDDKIGIVQNLGVDATITSVDANAGGIAAISSGMIQHCYTKGSIKADKNAGGIAGRNYGPIQHCYSTASCESEDTNNGLNGGIAGDNNGGSIKYCYATGAITSKDMAGGIAGTNFAKIENSIALNTSITGKDADQTGRITGWKGTLANNYASTEIKGEWAEREAGKKDGADLTDDNFIGKGADEGVFAGWLATAWDFGDNTNLPKVKTTGLDENILIGGQGDGSGNMPARSKFLEQTIEISTAITYDAATHKGNNITILSGGIFTVNTEEASIKKLTIMEGGQLVATQAFTYKELLAPRILGNKWIAYGSPIEMKAVTAASTTLYTMTGYATSAPADQAWQADTSETGTSSALTSPSLTAVEDNDLSVTFTSKAEGDTLLTFTADGTPTQGEALHTGIFVFCANPTLHNVTIPMAYVLSDDGTRFELTKDAVVKPFQSYLVANEITTRSVTVFRSGVMPTGNEQIAGNGFRVWGNKGQLHLSADSMSSVSIYTPSGQLLRAFTLTGEQTVTLGSGIYFVQSNNITYKVSL